MSVCICVVRVGPAPPPPPPRCPRQISIAPAATPGVGLTGPRGETILKLGACQSHDVASERSRAERENRAQPSRAEDAVVRCC